MSAEIIQFVPKPNLNREQAIQSLNPILIEIFNVALAETDTAPCEYVAPEKDPA